MHHGDLMQELQSEVLLLAICRKLDYTITLSLMALKSMKNRLVPSLTALMCPKCIKFSETWLHWDFHLLSVHRMDTNGTVVLIFIFLNGVSVFP